MVFDKWYLIREGFKKKKKRWKFPFLVLDPPFPKDGKVEQTKNFISRSYGVFTHNWYQRWKIKKKIPLLGLFDTTHYTDIA